MPARRTQPNVLAGGSWQGRPVLSFLLRAAIYAVPLAAGLGAAQAVAAAVEGSLGRWTTMALTLATGVGTSWLVTGATTRLLPLAVLLRMTMLFPDHAPSRLAVARRTTSTTELARRLASGEADERETATILLALVTALGRHDRKTRGHSERVRLYADLLGEQLGLDEWERGRLRWAALIHDIGKLQVAARILNKPGNLNAPEWVVIKSHPEAGARLAQPLATWLGPWFAGIVEHHERYDGTGYPAGLKGDEISLAGRAVAVVDAFETMTAARSYKAPMSTWAAREELTRCAGAHFDPVMVRAFLQIALPRVLRTVGPLAFAVNVPFLRWAGHSTMRAADVASGTVVSTVTAAGVSAAVVTGAGVPLAGAETYAPERRAPAAAAAPAHSASEGTPAAGASGRAERRSGAATDRGRADRTPAHSTGPRTRRDAERRSGPRPVEPTPAVGSDDPATPVQSQPPTGAGKAIDEPKAKRTKKAKPGRRHRHGPAKTARATPTPEATKSTARPRDPAPTTEPTSDPTPPEPTESVA